MVIVLSSNWKYDLDRKVGMYVSESNPNGVDVFTVEQDNLSAVKSSFASERMKEAARYKCVTLKGGEDIDIPLGIIRRVIKYQQIADKEDVYQYILKQSIIEENN